MTVTTKSSQWGPYTAARRPKNLWYCFAAMLPLGAAIGLAGCQPVADTSTVSPTPVPLPSTTASPAATSATSAPPTPAPSPAKPKAGPTLYVPGKDDLLHSHGFLDQKDAAKNLDQVISLAPLYFPKGTKVLKFTDDAKHATLDLTSQFNDQKFYSRGESITELAVSALVNSASTFSADPKKPIQLTVEGKPLSTLGEYDASDPIEPNPSLVAKP